jgi:DHA1 family bicyclomycin/chloramphenicol resistance-like MFS transporter
MHAGRARPKPALGLVILLGALTAFTALSIDMYLPGLPGIARGFHAGMGEAQLTVAAFLVGLAAGQLIYGPMSDRLGRRGPLLAGIGIYVAASIGCAVAPSIGVLIGMRAVQAVGACAGLVISRAVVSDLFEHRERVHVLSMQMLVMGLAPILAPLIGGYLLLLGPWRMIFVLLTGFGALMGLVVLLRLKESRPAEVAAQARAETPLRAYLALLRDREVMGYAMASAFASASLFAYISAAPAVLIQTYHVPVQAFGWLFGLNSVGIIGAGQLNRVLAHRFSSRSILRAANLAACLAAVVMIVSAWTGIGGAPGVLAPLWLVLASYGLSQPNAIALAMQAGGARSGGASAVFGFLQSGSGAVAAAAVAAMQDGTARPMAVVVAVVLFAGSAALALTRRERRGMAAEPEPEPQLQEIA